MYVCTYTCKYLMSFPSPIPSHLSTERPAGYYPPPPPGVASRPVPVSPKSIDTSNLPKPTPPPAASAPPPPSPTRMAKDGLDTGRTPPSPGGGPAKLSTRQGDCEKCKQPIRYSQITSLGNFEYTCVYLLCIAIREVRSIQMNTTKYVLRMCMNAKSSLPLGLLFLPLFPSHFSSPTHRLHLVFCPPV